MVAQSTEQGNRQIPVQAINFIYSDKPSLMVVSWAARLAEGPPTKEANTHVMLLATN
jgi:hypothetical protein